MTHIFNLVFVALCISVGMIWTAVPEISVADSSVPNVKYEVDAQQALQEAYTLFPSNQEKRIETFVSLYSILHPISAGWNVAEGCSIFYKSSKTYTYVSLSVNSTDGNNTTIKIFN